MKFDVYGRFMLEVARENDRWWGYRLSPGKRVPEPGIVLPASLDAAEIGQALDDLFHELARPGQRVEQLTCEIEQARTRHPCE
ncbi:MAG: hypothetical protein SF172_15255 [Burkholderiales bacterium]|nr:hypothetical protein [Burkholderiales bacterium]